MPLLKNMFFSKSALQTLQSGTVFLGCKLSLSILALIAVFFRAAPLPATITTPYSDEIQAVIFDCDGVLVDTEYLKFLAWQKALNDVGVCFTIEEYMPFVGHSSKAILEMVKKLKGIDISEKVIAIKNTRYKTLQQEGVPPIEKAIAFVHQLAKKKSSLGIKLGLASSAPKEEILQNLQQIGLQDCFDTIVSGSDDLDSYTDSVEKNKPKPYIYIEAAKRLDVTPSKCLVFEDTAAGIQAAFSAGMIAIAVPNQFTIDQDFSNATATISSYEDLISLGISKN